MTRRKKYFPSLLFLYVRTKLLDSVINASCNLLIANCFYGVKASEKYTDRKYKFPLLHKGEISETLTEVV